jgi:tRNA-specific 2-thiouridylase
MSKPKVFVMMSGGVDSSVAASVLQEKGYEVFGVYMKCWSIEQLDKLKVDESLYACEWEDDLLDAQTVANKLKIPFEVWDFQEEYLQRVVNYMLFEYKNGRTPNPDVMCNSTIKFGIFFEKAIGLGADFVATGHYAKMAINLEINLNSKEVFNSNLIQRANDTNKDQSYFLWKIKPSEINQVLFPVGEFENKSKVREYALEKGLVTATKKDSQGLCFIGKTPLRELLIQTIGDKKGIIVDQQNKVLGNHPGAHLYTIGQREKLNLSGGPWYVTKIDIASNVVTVTHGEDLKPLYAKKLTASELNWFLPSEFLKENLEFKLEAQIRYHQQPKTCTIKIVGDKVEVIFDEEIKAVSPGQSIVFYTGQNLIGGGIID